MDEIQNTYNSLVNSAKIVACARQSILRQLQDLVRKDIPNVLDEVDNLRWENCLSYVHSHNTRFRLNGQGGKISTRCERVKLSDEAYDLIHDLMENEGPFLTDDDRIDMAQSIDKLVSYILRNGDIPPDL